MAIAMAVFGGLSESFMYLFKFGEGMKFTMKMAFHDKDLIYRGKPFLKTF